MMVLLLSEFSKYSVINFSNAAISSSAAGLISEVMLQSLMLLLLEDFLELVVDWLLSVLVLPRDLELDFLGSVL